MKNKKALTNESGRKQASCPYCGEYKADANANFCGRCGRQLKENPVIIDYKSLAR